GPVVMALALVALVLAAWALGRPAAEWVGPLFFYDLVRLARRGRSTLLRFAYAVFLFVGLYVVYMNLFPQYDVFTDPFRPGPNVALPELGRFAGTFALAVLALQGAAVLVLTPAYLAGAVAEERERRTLELLFTTHLSDREIVLGKLFGRLTHLGGVLLAGLPVLCILELWGGIDPVVIVAGFAVTALTLLSVGSVCILISVVTRDSLKAVVIS